ncbi:MAG: MJ1255/VC2487 family glycosyltransferase [Thermodesulfobacteriota bacterium]
MKILFGVQGTGNGHITRSREVVRHLKAKGHDLRVIFSGRRPALLGELNDFEPYEYRQGLTFSTRRGRIQYLKTATRLNLPRLYRDVCAFDASRFDLVITDFEPVTSRIARRHGIPSIGIGHQYAFSYKIPIAGENPATRWMLLHFAPARYPLGLHWHHFDQPLLPPIVPRNLHRSDSPKFDKILVYLPFEYLPDVTRLLGTIASHQFYIYAPVLQNRDIGNLHFRPISRRAFLKDLTECGGVISNAGFELPGEAFHLGIRLLVKPLSGQLEQASNALAIKILGWGSVAEHLDKNRIEKWLTSPLPAAAQYPDTAKLMADWIDDGNWEDIAGLCRQAWGMTRFGEAGG